MTNYDDILVEANEKTMPEDFDKEAWGKKKQQMRDDAYALIDKTALAVGRGSFLQTYLDAQSRMTAVSANNVLLLTAQNPSVSQLKTYEEWESAGTSVKSGEKAISMLEKGLSYTKEDGSPGFNTDIKKVFDISQTHARNVAPVVNRDERHLLKALSNNSPAFIKPVDSMNGRDAQYDPTQKTIFIQKGMDAPNIFRALSREQAVALLDPSGKNRAAALFPAQCVSYMLCKRYGVDAGPVDITPSDSFESKDAKGIREELGSMKNAVGKIERNMRAVLEPDKNSRDHEPKR